MNVSTWSIKNPIPALMLFVLLTFGGLIAFNAMKVQNFPDMDLPTINVAASLEGAAQEALEKIVVSIKSFDADKGSFRAWALTTLPCASRSS